SRRSVCRSRNRSGRWRARGSALLLHYVRRWWCVTSTGAWADFLDGVCVRGRPNGRAPVAPGCTRTNLPVRRIRVGVGLAVGFGGFRLAGAAFFVLTALLGLARSGVRVGDAPATGLGELGETTERHDG